MTLIQTFAYPPINSMKQEGAASPVCKSGQEAELCLGTQLAKPGFELRKSVWKPAA